MSRSWGAAMIVAVGVASFGACGDDAGRGVADVEDVEATITAAGEALAAGDVEAFVDLWTDNGMQEVFSETTGTFPTQTGYYVRARQISMGSASKTTVSGDTATTVAPLFFRLVGAPRRFALVQRGGSWKIDGAMATTTEVQDVLTVDVTFGDIDMAFDGSVIVDGNVALNVRNTALHSHEFNIMTVPASLDIAGFFEHPEGAAELPEGQSMPAGMDFVGSVTPIEAGSSVTVLFASPLPAGRYVLFCNVDDPATGQPHARLGEFAEFTIG